RPGEMGAAANTHRALQQDEVRETTQLLEDVLTSDNPRRACKRVKANKLEGEQMPGPPATPRSSGAPTLNFNETWLDNRYFVNTI
ncbi:MAG: hypothetical protein LH632_19200, partial [Rhodoferax sp.]|nr:hypothetical protein [Rhodoferax sp.]